jgi:hypothetical protein
MPEKYFSFLNWENLQYFVLQTLIKTIPMTDRRKFLLQSSLAATALLAANPINALAKYSSPLTGGHYNFNNITFLHTAGADFSMAELVKKITDKNTSVVLLHAGNDGGPETQQLHYDVSHHSLNETHEGGYKIVDKDNIRVGVIAVNANEHNTGNRVNDLAAWLKKEKNCHFVVCISQLGYKNKNKTDDITLAGTSEHIDIIVGKHASTSPKRPVTVFNKKRAEVIIQHIRDKEAAPGKIKIGLDPFGGKFNISF